MVRTENVRPPDRSGGYAIVLGGRMDDIEDRVAQSGLRHVLDTPLHELELQGLDPTTSKRLRQASLKRSRGLTVSLALNILRPQDRRVLEGWLSRLVGEAKRPVAGMTRADLVAWASERHLDWALEAPVRGLDHPMARWTELEVWELVTIPANFNEWWFDPQLQHQAVQWLEEIAQTAAWAQDLETARRGAWGRGPTHPALRPLWESLWTQYQDLRGEGPPTYLFPGTIEAQADPPALVLSGHREVTYPLDGQPLPLPPEHHLALGTVVGLLEYVCTDPAPEGLVEALTKPQWQRDLDFLDRLIAPDQPDPSDDKDLMGWEILQNADRIDLTAVRCRVTRSGGLQCRRTHVQEVPSSMLSDPQDARVASLLHRWKLAPREVVLEAIAALAGHPRVVRTVDRSRERIEVRTAPLTLEVTDGPDGVTVGFSAAGRSVDPSHLEAALSGNDAAGGRVALVLGAEVWVLGCTEAQRSFVLQFLRRRVSLPPDAVRELLGRLPRIQEILPVRLDPTLRGDEVPGDRRPLFRVAFRQQCVVIEARVQPLPDAPSHPPGQGPDTLHVVRNDRPAVHVRDRSAEIGQVRSIARDLGLPDAAEQRPFLWAIDDLEAALDLVRALDPNEHRVEVEGHLPSIAQASGQDLSLTVGSGHDWFAVDGELTTPMGAVQLDQVLTAVEEGRSYVALGGGYVRLEDALALRIKALTSARTRKELRLGAVHAPLLAALERVGATISGAAQWRDLAEGLRSAQQIEIALPEELVATMRPYQLDGFGWLARLAQWSPGAVLADDMGLGKTVQAIALLLRRRRSGPALVVAPTSVAFNWRAELARFAPSLRIVPYMGPARSALLEGLGPGDVVVTSYGLMWRDAEVLQQRHFGTVILDEAQAIKNPTSRRFKAARDLDAGFRLALSGTPVENRPLELWAIFAATVPGLLGTLEQFRKRFACDGPRNRAALARLVRPFLLRRTKEKVAPELPARTQMVDRLEMGPEHRALYLRARQQAIARIEDATPDKRRFLLLGELTRLRQLACDPRLADAGSPIRGSKIGHVAARLEDLRQAGAQALVFSTFVRQLELLRPVLEQAGFRVAWLTGSTPARAREAEVARFQEGQADVFLVSLKAGGTGLNLTAASYVFLLDPWWNPAAEDQATDRAHRIGQTRPVHVYRVVAADTIEEQILALHEEKRDLVNDLIAGADGGRGMGAEELMALLASGGQDRPPAEADGAADLPRAPTADAPPGPEARAQAADLEAILEDALGRLSLAPSTIRAYRRAIHQLIAWGQAQQPDPIQTPAQVADLLPAYAAAAEGGSVPPSRIGAARAALKRLAWSGSK